MEGQPEAKFYRLRIREEIKHGSYGVERRDHTILYDSGSSTGIEIAPQFQILSDQTLGHILMYVFDGMTKPPTVTDFKVEELTGDEYDSLRKSMSDLERAKRSFDERLKETGIDGLK